MHYYSDEKNTQILIALLKAHDIRDIVISPGATNFNFVMSVQDDSDFRLYSAVDERHAGYLACGLSQETGRPVVINCTGATASRNYMPALTEAYYRKLPVIAVTCSQHISHLGNMYPQMTDRCHLPTDVAKLSVQCPIPHTKEEEHSCALKINTALLETRHRGGGPVHINLETDYNPSFSCVRLPDVQKISRYEANQKQWPEILPQNKRILIWIGAHGPFTNEEIIAIEKFSRSRDAIILTDITSNYTGMNAIKAALICSQYGNSSSREMALLIPDLIIHIGEISGDYYTTNWLNGKAPVWRVSEDGEIRDKTGMLSAVFETTELQFFSHYSMSGGESASKYAEAWISLDRKMRDNIPTIPFSNLWVANALAKEIPAAAVLHFGILNPLRCWNLSAAKVERAYCLTGGLGIDGGTSSLIGSALATPGRMHLGVFGDLAFFYDLNALGSRHLGKNVRIVVINNDGGGEFLIPNAHYDSCGEKVHEFTAASGHFGGKNSNAIAHIARAFNLRYFLARTKDEFMKQLPQFLSVDDGPALFECRIDVMNDRAALKAYFSILPHPHTPQTNSSLVTFVKARIPSRVKNAIKAAIA